MDINLIVIGLSLTLQVAAVILGARLILRTGNRSAGLLIMTAISLMACRRGISFYRLLAGGPIRTDTIAELTGLVVSLLMVIGVWCLTDFILANARLVMERQKAVEEVKRLNEQLERRIQERTMALEASNRSLAEKNAELRRVGEEIRASRQQLLDIIDFFPDATFVVDNDKKVIFWNNAMATMTGVSKAEMIGQGDRAYTLPFYGERRPNLLDLLDVSASELADAYQNIQKKNNILCAETFCPALYGGKGAYVWATASFLCDAQGARVGAIESVRDTTDFWKAKEALTLAYAEMESRVQERTAELAESNTALSAENAERIRTEEALLESRKQYLQLFNKMSSGLLVFDVLSDESGTPFDYRLVNYNPACERLSGLDLREMIGLTGKDLPFGWYPELVQQFFQVAMTAQPIQYERFNETLGRHYETYVFSPSRGQFAHLFNDISPRKQTENQLQNSLREKEVLLKEIHHRVKNNMQVVYSLLNLQARGIDDPAARAMLEEARNRVMSMALIHEGLYHSKNLAAIDFKIYLQNLVAGVVSTYSRPEVAVVVDMESVALDVNVGIPCGLMVNELVANSFKHAFPGGRKGTIVVGLTISRAGDYVLAVADDGIGLPEAMDFQNSRSLGLQLVTQLTRQIHGTLDVERAAGSRFVITFPDGEGAQGRAPEV